jgi:hypothetical protein
MRKFNCEQIGCKQGEIRVFTGALTGFAVYTVKVKTCL